MSKIQVFFGLNSSFAPSPYALELHTPMNCMVDGVCWSSFLVYNILYLNGVRHRNIILRQHLWNVYFPYIKIKCLYLCKSCRISTRTVHSGFVFDCVQRRWVGCIWWLWIMTYKRIHIMVNYNVEIRLRNFNIYTRAQDNNEFSFR